MTHGISVAGRRPPCRFLDYVIGVDLGQTTNYTAIVVIQRRLFESDRIDYVTFGWVSELSDRVVVLVERLPLNTSYPDVNARLVSIDAKLRARLAAMALDDPRHVSADPHFFVDATGGGIPVVDYLRGQLRGRLHAVTFTGGLQTTGTKRDPNVPKVALVSWLAADLQSGVLGLAAGMPMLEDLEKELIGMQARSTPGGRVVMAAGVSSKHDDIVCGAALANYGARTLSMADGSAETGRLL